VRLGRLWSQPGGVWVGFGGFLLISGDDVMKNSSQDLDRRSMERPLNGTGPISL